MSTATNKAFDCCNKQFNIIKQFQMSKTDALLYNTKTLHILDIDILNAQRLATLLNKELLSVVQVLLYVYSY